MTKRLLGKTEANVSLARAGVSVAVWALIAGSIMLTQAEDATLTGTAGGNSPIFNSEQQSVARTIDLDRRAQDIAQQKQRLDLLVNENPALPPILERHTLLKLSSQAVIDGIGGPLHQEEQASTPRPHIKPTAEQLHATLAQQSDMTTVSYIADHALTDISAKFGAISSAYSNTSQSQDMVWHFETSVDIENELNQIEANQADALIWIHEQIDQAIADRVAILKKTGLATEDVFTSISSLVPALVDDNDVQVGGPLVESATHNDGPAPLAAYTSDQSVTDWNAGSALNDNEKALDQLAALNDVLMALPIRFPTVESRVWTSSRYGYRRDAFTKRRAFHSGLDLAGRRGVPVMATAEGIVIHAGPKGAYGNLVAISHGYGLKTRYAHLSRVDVKVGDTVAVGTPIGLIGSTGRSTGSHLHYEIWNGKNSRDPLPFIEAGRELSELIK